MNYEDTEGEAMGWETWMRCPILSLPLSFAFWGKFSNKRPKGKSMELPCTPSGVPHSLDHLSTAQSPGKPDALT